MLSTGLRIRLFCTKLLEPVELDVANSIGYNYHWLEQTISVCSSTGLLGRMTMKAVNLKMNECTKLFEQNFQITFRNAKEKPTALP